VLHCITSELSSNTERTKRLQNGAMRPFKLEDQVFDRGEAEFYLEPVRFRVSTAMLQTKRGRRGRIRRVMTIDIEILSEIEGCARMLQFILDIANSIRTWPYQNSEAADFRVLLFDRTMAYTVEYDKWREACENKETNIFSEMASKNIEMSDFRSWEPFYELFSEHHTLRHTFDLCEPSSGEDRKEVIQLKTVRKNFEQLYPSESRHSIGQRMKSVSSSATKRGNITFKEYVELMWMERGLQLREAKNASDFGARLDAWMRPLTSFEEVPGHLAFAFALPIDKQDLMLDLEKDIRMLEDVNKANGIEYGDGTVVKHNKLHTSKWRATKDNISRALRSKCFALLVGCHCSEKHGLEFEPDNPGGKAVYVSPDEFSQLIMETKETPKICSLKVLMLAACESEAVAEGFVDSKVVDHIIVCNKNKLLGNKAVQIFQTVFFERLLCGATVSTSFKSAKEKLKDMASDLKKEAGVLIKKADNLEKYIADPRICNVYHEYKSRTKKLTKRAEQLYEEVKECLLLPKDGNHDIAFSFKPYFPPFAKIKTWHPAPPIKFYPDPFCEQLKWGTDHYLQLQRNLHSALQFDDKNSIRHRWVQITGPKNIGKTSVAKFIAWRLSLYDTEGPDGIFWVTGAKSGDGVMQNFMENLIEDESFPTKKAENCDPYGLIKGFFRKKDNPPTLLIIDDVEGVKAEDREKLFKNLMILNPRLHILTTSLTPIEVKGCDSNKKDLKLEGLPKIKFKNFFKERVYDFEDSKYKTLIRENVKPYHFTKLEAAITRVNMNPRTAILLVRKIHEMSSDVDESNEINKLIKDKSFLVKVYNKLVEEKAV